jgi:hypothetical protein
MSQSVYTEQSSEKTFDQDKTLSIKHMKDKFIFVLQHHVNTYGEMKANLQKFNTGNKRR